MYQCTLIDSTRTQCCTKRFVKTLDKNFHGLRSQIDAIVTRNKCQSMEDAICFTQEVAVILKQWKPKQTKETAVVSAKWDRERSPDFRIEESISRHGCETRMRCGSRFTSQFFKLNYCRWDSPKDAIHYTQLYFLAAYLLNMLTLCQGHQKWLKALVSPVN